MMRPQDPPGRSVLNGPDQLALEADAVRLFAHPAVQAAVRAKRAAFEAHPLAGTPAGRATLALNLEEMAFSAVVSVVAMDVGRTSPFWTLNLPHDRGGLRVPGTRHGVDNPDNVYRVIAVDDVSDFRIDGQVNDRPGADVSFTLFNAYPGAGVDSQSQGVLLLDQLDKDADGRFSFTVGPDAAGDRANHLQTRPGAARLIFVRDSLQDWAVETPVSLAVTRTAGPEVTAPTEDELVAKAIEAVGASIDYWLRLMPQWFGTPFNAIAKGRAKNFSYTQQATSEARFRLAADEALVVTIDPCGARYLGVQLADPWGASMDYGAHTCSLNQRQAHRSADGTITYVVSLSDPGVHNWLDPAGLEQGTMLHRWQGLPDGGFDSERSVRSSRVVKLDQLASVLPTDMRRVTPAERSQQLAQRAAGLARRLDRSQEDTMASDIHFDPFEEDALADPGAAYGALRAACPFHHQPAQDGRPDFYVLSDHAEIKTDILQGNPIWSFRFGNAMKDSISDVGFKTDGDFHAAFRMVVQRGLTPPMVKAWRPKIEAIVDELVDAMLAIPEGRGDFYSLFALPLPARMMCRMLGAPEADYQNYKRWSDTLQFLTFEDPEPGSYETVLREIYPHFTTLIEQRQALLAAAGIDEPDLSHLGAVLPDDFMSRALVSRVEGRRLTHEEMLNICLAFLTGGQETTTNLIGHLLRRLLEAPERWERLKADPSLIDNAVEESLRFDPPVLAHFRTSLGETQMHGHDIPERAKLMFSICGANRDPAVFEAPDEFRIDRPLPEARQHLSFGSGVHLCLGAPVARLEARIALERLIERLPNLRLLGVGGRVRTWMYWGHTGLDVAWS